MDKKDKIIKLKIITPEKTVYQDDVLSIAIPTEAGEITVLPDHQPLVTIAVTGEIRIKKPDQNEVVPLAISSGIVEVRESFNPKNISTEVVILAYRAEFAFQIDIDRAKESLERAQKLLEQKEFESDVDFAKFQAMMDKEINRIEIFKKWRS